MSKMKGVKTLLLGTAAGFMAVAGAQAADMPDLPILRGAFTDGLSSSKTNWQGFYAGVQGGYGVSDENFNGSTSNMTKALLADTLIEAQRGSNLFKQSALNEKGQVINGFGDTPNTHDMLTGSQTDGRAYTDNADHTCNNWTSSSMGSAQLGHSDRTGGGNRSWNSAHASRGCSQADLVATGGAGLFYCFAIN